MNPIAFKELATFTGIGFLVIASIKTKSSLPPSSAGNGIKFMIAKLATKMPKYCGPNLFAKKNCVKKKNILLKPAPTTIRDKSKIFFLYFGKLNNI